MGIAPKIYIIEQITTIKDMLTTDNTAIKKI